MEYLWSNHFFLLINLAVRSTRINNLYPFVKGEISLVVYFNLCQERKLHIGDVHKMIS